MATNVRVGANTNMITSVTLTSRPSRTASTTSVVIACRMVSCEQKRDTTSPR